MMTLRQIEVMRAIMVSGTIAGAAKLLNVSAPGISRLVKYTESSLQLRLFTRRNGRFEPAPEAQDIFEQINAVYKKVDDLSGTLAQMKRGAFAELRIGSVPSIAQVMAPRAIEKVRQKYPALKIDINILKIEEAIDYLLLGRGEVVAMSYRFDHPAINFEPLASGDLFCIVPQGHVLAARTSISPAEITRFPLIGIDPNDPYGGIMAEIFRRQALDYEITIRARFGTTVCALVRAGLGVAVIDQFTVAHGGAPGVIIIPIDVPTRFETYVAFRQGRELSPYAAFFVAALRREMLASG